VVRGKETRVSYIYLLVALLVVGDILVFLCWRRECRRHDKTSSALRFWQRNGHMSIDPARFVK